MKNISNNLSKTFILCLLLCSFGIMQAQNKKTPPPTASKTTLSPEAATLKIKFNEFIAAYSTIEKTKDVKSVLNHVSNDVISTLVSFDLTGKMNILYSDYKGFATYLDKLTTTDNLVVNYTLENIDKIYVSGNLAIIVYGVSYENKRGGNVWSKGFENVTLTYKKIAGEWKIVQYVVTQIEDEKTKVACICELTVENNAQDFVMKTTIPSGRSYVTELNPIGFMFPDGGKLIVVGEKYYKWLSNGDINFMEEATDNKAVKETKIAVVTDQNDRQKAVETILTQHYYKSVCNEVEIKANKR
jgi:hypothetical protein